jgi:ABC-2 type transport system permease protein
VSSNDAPTPLPPLGGLFARQVVHQLRLLSRTPRAVFGGALLPLLLLVLRQGDVHGSSAREAQLVAGLAVLGILSTAYITHASGLVAAREAGVLKRWRASPLPSLCFIGGRLAATVLLATAGGLAIVLTGVAFYGAHLDARGALGLLVTLALGATAWASLGTAATTVIPTTDAAWPLLGASYLPIVLLSGALGTTSGVPQWLSTAVRSLPARPMIDGATRALDGAPQQGFALSGRDLVVLVVWTAAGLLISQRRFHWQPRPSRHRRGAAAR